MLSDLARWCSRRRRLVVFGVWLPLLIVSSAASGAIGNDFSTDFSLPDSEAADVQSRLQEARPELSGDTAQIVFASPDGFDSPQVRSGIDGLLASVDELDDVEVVSPFDRPGQISDDGTVAFAQLNINDVDLEELTSLAGDIEDLGDESPIEGVTIEHGGAAFGIFEMPKSELLGVIAAVIILIVAFGSVLAMGLPIGTALFGLGIGTAIVTFLSRVMSMPDFTVQMVAMIGLGVGIDYALFIVTRYREGLRAGLDVEEAVVESIDTAGRAVLFAGATVIISLLGLYVVGLGFVRGLATSAAVGVLVMMLGSVTLLPALLTMVGTRIGTTTRAALGAVALAVVGGIAWIITDVAAIAIAGLVLACALYAASFRFRALRQELPARSEKPTERTFWYRWSHFVQRRPWPVLLGAAAVLVVLALPLFSIRLGFGDTGNLSENQTARRAYDTLADAFGEGTSGPLLITVEGAAAADEQALAAFGESVAATEGVAAVAGPPTQLADDLALLTLFPTSSPQDAETADLVDRLRDETVPASGLDAQVGGFTAASVDFSEYLGERLPILIGAVLVLSFLLLMVVFRSILVPLKAVVLNLLSIGAAYGVVVAVFQFGWGMQLIGVDRAGPIEAWAPMMLFAIVFGLSMDYEVFLLSRIKEHYDRTGDNYTAVADGLTATARVITAAALIMVCVFGAFVLGEDRQLKLFGLGLAVAVALDATIVRMLLVPATMELLGKRNWWIPPWLDRLLPEVDVEGHHIEPHAAESAAADDDTERREPELIG